MKPLSLPISGLILFFLLLAAPHNVWAVVDDNWDSAFASFAPGDEVLAIATNGINIYVGGLFTNIGPVAANYIARWNGSSWTPLINSINTSNGVNHYVFAIAVNGTDVYVGGDFTKAGGNAAKGIAKWNGSIWSTLTSGGTNGLNDAAYALAINGTNLYAGGYFATAGGATVNGIARWDGTRWSALGSGVDIGVQALAIIGTNLYVGGLFGNAGGVSVNNIARWDGAHWFALAGGVGDPGVTALAISGTNLYAAGDFTTPGNYIARWNGTSWSTLSTGLKSNANTVAVSGTNVYVGGLFAMVGMTVANKIACWNGATWSTLGSGLSSDVWSIATTTNGDVFVGGDFTTAGAKPSLHFARWNLDLDGDGMPNEWELAYGFNPYFAGDGALDADGDGLSNLQEFLAGTNPTNAASVLRITSLQRTNTTFVIAFPSVSEKSYTIERCDDLVLGPWTNLTNNITGTGATLQIIDPGATNLPRRFYRLKLLP